MIKANENALEGYRIDQLLEVDRMPRLKPLIDAALSPTANVKMVAEHSTGNLIPLPLLLYLALYIISSVASESAVESGLGIEHQAKPRVRNS